MSLPSTEDLKAIRDMFYGNAVTTHAFAALGLLYRAEDVLFVDYDTDANDLALPSQTCFTRMSVVQMTPADSSTGEVLVRVLPLSAVTKIEIHGLTGWYDPMAQQPTIVRDGIGLTFKDGTELRFPNRPLPDAAAVHAVLGAVQAAAGL